MDTVTAEPIPAYRETTLPYPPSIIDRFMRFIQRLPLPYWLTYLLVLTLHILIAHILDWVDGSTPAFHFRLILCLWPVLIWGPLAIMTYLDATARKALANFSPLLDIRPETMQRLEYEFTTMPSRGVLIRGIFFMILYVLFILRLDLPVIEPSLKATPPTVVFVVVESFFAFNNALLYHTLRQLRLVNRTVKLVKQFDLFRLDAVYAFSHLTARTGVAWLLLASLVLLIVPVQLSPIPVLAFQAIGIVSAVAAFALPLWVVHKQLAAEKRRLMAAHGQRIKSTLARLHNAVDENDLRDVAQLSSVLDGLSIEGNILEKIRTLPWSTGTLTAFITAIVLPMALFFIQLAIQKMLHL